MWSFREKFLHDNGLGDSPNTSQSRIAPPYIHFRFVVRILFQSIRLQYSLSFPYFFENYYLTRTFPRNLSKQDLAFFLRKLFDDLYVSGDSPKLKTRIYVEGSRCSMTPLATFCQ